MHDGKVLRRQEGHDSETVEEEEVAHRPVSGCRRHRRVDAKPDTGNSSGYANTVISEIATPDSPRTTNPKLRYMLSPQALR
jgi:hypothetical protein